MSINNQKVYFCCSVQGDRKNIVNCQAIVQKIKNLGHIVLTDYVVHDNPDQKFVDQNNSMEKFDHMEIRRESVKKLNECTCLVADFSGASTGVGMEIEIARHRGVPILCMYYFPMEASATWMVRGMDDPHEYPNILVRKYSNLLEIVEILQYFFNSFLLKTQ